MIDTTMFLILVGAGIALLIFGASRESIGAGAMFFAFAGIIFLGIGVFLFGGLQLNSVSQFVDSATGTQVVYNVATAGTGEPIWIVAWTSLISGISLILVSMGLIGRQRMLNKMVLSEPAL